MKGSFLSSACIPTRIVKSKGHSFYTILTLCGSCIDVFPHGLQHPEGIPGLTNSVANIASGPSIVSNSPTKIRELFCVWQGIFLYFYWDGILKVQSHYFCLLLADHVLLRCVVCCCFFLGVRACM